MKRLTNPANLLLLIIPVLPLYTAFGHMPAGPSLSVHVRILPVRDKNVSAFAGNNKPDMLYVFFTAPVTYRRKSGEMNSYILPEAEDDSANRAAIDRELALQNVKFFRHIYKNSSGRIYRFTDIDLRGKTLQEVTVTDVNQSFDREEYYPWGSIRSKTQYALDSAYKADWWRRDSLRYVKNGVEKIYYPNNQLRIEKRYQHDKLVDTVYTEYYSTGAVKKTYARKGRTVSGVKSYDKSGKSIPADLAYKRAFSPHKRAFLFGVGTFDTTTDWHTISSGNDIDLLKASLLDQGFPEHNITVVQDTAASKHTVLMAFDRFVASIRKEDIVMVHFSGYSLYLQDTQDTTQFNMVIPCYDGMSPWTAKSRNIPEEVFLKNYIVQAELDDFISSLRRKAGRRGQVYLTLDVNGTTAEGKDRDTPEKTVKAAYRGEENTLLGPVMNTGAPLFIYTAAARGELNYEIRDANAKNYGALSYTLAKSLADPTVSSTADLFYSVQELMKSLVPRQHPGYFSREDQLLFEPDDTSGSELGTLPDLQITGTSYIISIGVSLYMGYDPAQLSFSNCVSDAAGYSRFFTSQFGSADFQSHPVLLTDSAATKKNILDAINRVINDSKPDDYFVFNFSGYSKPIRDSNGRQVTYFVPFGLGNISDDAEIKREGISLTQLKDLLQLVPANNQLFITEAGTTIDFQREFIKALMETSPTIAQLSKKNRIFIVPKGAGMDRFTCSNLQRNQGPINYFITSLNPGLNIYGLFQEGSYADAVRYDLVKTETGCRFSGTAYFDVFFERSFTSDLKYFLPEEVMQMRGPTIVEKERKALQTSITNRYAIVMGTDRYWGKPDWRDLDNPYDDAREIARLLKEHFAYNISLLKDTTAEGLYREIALLAGKLQPTDQVIIYIAGHGTFDDKLFDDGFIVCKDSRPIKEDPYRNTYIQYSKFSRMLNKLEAQQILLILDVCFGGTFDERIARNKTRGDYDDLSSENFFREKMKKKTRLYLSSGGKQEVPDGYRGKHSPFALRLLQALETKGGASKMLTADNLYLYVNKLPSGPVLGSFGDDEPGSEYILLGGSETDRSK